MCENKSEGGRQLTIGDKVFADEVEESEEVDEILRSGDSKEVDATENHYKLTKYSRGKEQMMQDVLK
jgi:hypothetical protein